ncbi:MAG TPA: DUF4124 domain-containing protein [Usitatibacter sp.]|nr:DUF4124 domain-containing protein [Usitatibacter sp.]
MSSRSWKAATDGGLRGPFLGAVACALFSLSVATAASATPRVFYKWVGPDGHTHYADAPPKGFTGQVTRIEVDPGAYAAPPSPGVAKEEKAPSAPGPDLLQQRRETRARLEANLEQARARLDQARKALADAQEPHEDEWQVTQFSLPVGPGQVPRSNCRKVQGGKVICPGRVPSEQYYERLDQLQQEVKLAEQAVEDAERAYRRGVD